MTTPKGVPERSVGITLREAREAKGLSLEQTSRATRIHPNVLKQIESDQIQSLGAVYARSFLKIYADFLGVDKKEILENFERATGMVSPPRRTNAHAAAKPAPAAGGAAPSGKKVVLEAASFLADVLRRIPWKAVGITACCFIVLYGTVKFIRRPRTKRPVAAQAVKAKKAAVPAKATAKPKASAAVKPAPVFVAPKPAAPVPAPSAEAVRVEAKEAEVPAKPAAPKVILVIRAREKAFLQVKTDGRIVFQGMLSKGTAESWKAQDKIELWLGNAGAFQLELNGRPIERVGRPGQSLRRVVVTASGLKIER